MATKVVLKNGETRWKDRVTLNGVRKKVTARTKDELKAAMLDLESRERRRKLGISEPAGVIPIGYADLVEKFLTQYQQRASTRRFTKQYLDYSLAHFGKWWVQDITVDDVEGWFVNLKGKRGGELSAKSKGHALVAMKTLLNYAVDRNHLTANPAKKVTKPKAKGQRKDSAKPFESWAEVEAVANALQTYYERGRALVMFVAATGLRTQEWQVLRWSDFDLSVPCVTVNRTMQVEGEEAVGKTDDSLGSVTLPERALEALRALPRPTTGKELLFPDPSGERPWSLHTFRYGTKGDNRGPWKLALEDAGVEYRGPYQLRHTFATLALEKGVPLEWISKQLRHTNVEMTRQAYARWTKKAEEKWLAVLNAPEEADPNRLSDLLERLG